jgi:ATP-binding protein involved in chromosome partitioning
MSDGNECASCGVETCSAPTQKPGENNEAFLDRQAIASRMCKIKHKIMVLSGKGGVGKSTVSVNLAVSLALAGKRVGLLDIDIHGPNVPQMLGIESGGLVGNDNALLPFEARENLYVMSVALLMRQRDEAIIWRGPRKYALIKQFIRDVEWGELDYLIVDCPPGTGDEPLSIVELVGDADGGIVVTTPQDVAVLDVRRSIRFCQTMKLPVLGVVENMSGFVCPECSAHVDIFGSGGGKALAEELEVDFLGAIPIDPRIVRSGDEGEPVVLADPHGESAKAFGRVVRRLLEDDLAKNEVAAVTGNGTMTIAVPVAGGLLCQHFGHCEQFALYEVDTDAKTVIRKTMRTPPVHEPGVLPKWLHDEGADLVISGGMGSRAQSLFQQAQVTVVTGAPAGDPEKVVLDYLESRLETGDNICDH